MQACRFIPLLLVMVAGARADTRWDLAIAPVATRPGYVNPGADFAADLSGTFHACYSSTEAAEDTVTYLRWTPGGLQERVKLSNLPRRTYVPKIALTSAGEPVVLFVDAGGVKLARRASGTWSTEVLSSSGHFEFADLSLAIDASDRAHVLFNGIDQNDRIFLRYMHEGEAGWTSDDLHSPVPLYGNHGQFHDLVLDEDGSPHIVYQESSGDSTYFPVKYVYRNPEGGFETEHVSD